MRASRWKAAVVLTVTYLAVVVATLGLRDTSIRPLFDGFAPAPKYRWVEPPPPFSAGNRAPDGATASVALDAAGSRPLGLATDDAQAVISLGAGAIAPHGSDRKVRIEITPQSGAELRLPDHLRANGNAYRVTMTYEPSGTPVRRLRRPGTLSLAIPELDRTLFRFQHSHRTALTSRGVTPAWTTIVTQLPGSGTYLSSTDLPLPPGPGTTTSDHTVLVVVGVGVIAVGLVALAALVARRRRARAS